MVGKKTIGGMKAKFLPLLACSVLSVSACDAGMRETMVERENTALEEAFRGVSTSVGIQQGLFSISETGVSTGPVVDAATNFVEMFSQDQQANFMFDVEADQWRRWSNVDNKIYTRQGISLRDMTEDQRAAAIALMRASLSAEGLTLSQNIMKTDKTLSEMNDNAVHLDEQLYFFTIMGTPSLTQPWGWQLDGHHLVINYFVLGDQVVMSPVFMGGEPTVTTTGVHSGNEILQPEQNVGLELMQMLSADQQSRATLGTEKGTNDNQAAALQDNVTLDYEGLPASEMANDQRTKLIELIGLYVGNIREPHAEVRKEEVLEHLDDTWFAWIGETGDDAVFYYRIHSPVILIEFDHQGPIGVPGDDRSPTRNHIHTVVRTPNGNDYGKDLLRQHLEEDHSH